MSKKEIWFERQKLDNRQEKSKKSKKVMVEIFISKDDLMKLDYLYKKYANSYTSKNDVIHELIIQQYDFEKDDDRLENYDRRIDNVVNMLDDLCDKYHLAEKNISIVWDKKSNKYIFKHESTSKQFAELMETHQQAKKELNSITKYALQLYDEGVLEDFGYNYLSTGIISE